jgi:hypothetical protein
VAERVPPPEEQVPPPGEPVHLPGPSYLPALVAAGISVALVGVVIYWALVVIGSLVTIVALVRWIRQVREEMAELPLDH